MILEIAVLDVIAGREREFEKSFAHAQRIIRSMHGYVSHELKRCVERPSRYVLLVNWEHVEDHTEGFRNSPEYQEWRTLLHHYYDPPPQVAHYRDVELQPA
ncbi:MAG TPA: antibiotic biosynthesis monooxygenase [Gammaproteobacteria bacterium]|nr:antibiotic biosynthesis monooxygenase [Gammaproteobacteria bacterium]